MHVILTLLQVAGTQGTDLGRIYLIDLGLVPSEFRGRVVVR